ncbi:hypothetical protein FRC17_007208, partial [Serendipita sp. 399]
LWESIRLSKILLDGSPAVEASTIAFPPSHVLAFSIPTGHQSDSSTQITLWPIHDVIVAHYCSSIPALPSNGIITSTSPTYNAVPLVVPHPKSLRIIFRYLYVQNTALLFRSLLPPCIKNPTKLVKLSRKHLSRRYSSIPTVKHTTTKLPVILAKLCPTPLLLSRLDLVRRLSENVVALGIEDSQLRAILKMLSRILADALRIRRYLGRGT